MVGEWRQQFSHDMTAASGQQTLLVADRTDYELTVSHLTVVLSPWSQRTSVVYCSVCLDAPVTQAVPHQLVDSKLVVSLEPTNMTSAEGVESCSRRPIPPSCHGTTSFAFVYDMTPPVVHLSAEQTTFERKPINVYPPSMMATGAEFSTAWTD